MAFGQDKLMHMRLPGAAVPQPEWRVRAPLLKIGPPPMTDIRIVCAHDAAKLAEALTRLFEAEEHRVRLSCGRQSLAELETARSDREAVVLIWSPNARPQTYMIEWSRQIDPWRLIELANGTNDWPAIKRNSAVIDFTTWRGQRGAKAWKLLIDRLDSIERASNPVKPSPAKVAIAAGLASAAAIAGAFVMRTPAPGEEIDLTPLEDVASLDQEGGIGGPLRAVEPASMDDEEEVRLRRYPELDSLDNTLAEPLAPLAEYREVELRDPTLLERLDSFIPLRRGNDRAGQ